MQGTIYSLGPGVDHHHSRY